jgi:hypothetical protein
MINQQLLDYISTQKRNGISDDVIKQALLSNGWDQADVNNAISSLISQREIIDPAGSVPTATVSHADATAAVQKMGKFKASWRLFNQSINLLKQDKEIMLFPVVSTITVLLVTILFGLTLFALYPLLGLGEDTSSQSQDIIIYGIIFVYYVIAFFITTYFKVGLTAVVYERINGGDINFKDGIKRANGIAGKIFLWSIITSTVGIILKIVSDKSKWLGKLVASLLGAAWNVVTMFIAPTLLLDNVSVWQSIGRSAEVFKKTWGETLILNISFSIIVFLSVLLNILFFGLLAFAVLAAGFGTIGLLIVGVPFVLSLVIITILSNSLNEIFKVVLYSYARFGIIAEGFSPELIVGAVKSNTK